MNLSRLIFTCHIVDENQAITRYRPVADEGAEGIPTKSFFGVLQDHFCWCQIFSFFPETTITLLDSHQNHPDSVNKFSLVAEYIYLSGDDFRSKFSHTQICERGFYRGEGVAKTILV